MLKEFVEFCEDLFPSISPYKVDSLKHAMDQFYHEGKTFDFNTSVPLGYLAQGDMFSELPFTYYDEKGEELTIKRKAMLLSNTCDASRNETLIFAAIISISDLGFNSNTLKELKNNKLTQFLFLPGSDTLNEVVDFGLIGTFSRDPIDYMIKKGLLQKEYSLNEYGFYMLLSKLTIYFCRRQDVNTEYDRKKEILEKCLC